MTASLVERADCLDALSEALASARRGDGCSVLVTGEAGIGKTSLVERFTGEATIGRLMWGSCDALSTPHPLGPLHDLARTDFAPAPHGRLRTLLAEGTDRAALFAAVLDELSTPPAPVVLVVEDLHWADAATLDLIRFLGRRIHRVAALMILTFRDDVLEPGHPLRSALAHLPSRHVRRLAPTRLSPTAVRDLARAARRDEAGLHALTGGNPFFVTEVLAHPDGRLPGTLIDAVLARGASLDAAARQVLELAALVPRAIETALIERILAPAPAAFEDCLASGLLLADERTLRFRHELARVAVEQSIARSRSRPMHAAILAALTGSSAVAPGPVALARLVHHAHLADDGAAVLRLAPAAASEATARGARREAAAHCEVALGYAHALPDLDRARLLEAYAGHRFELGDLAAAIRAREAAIALFEKAGDREGLCGSLAEHAMPLVRALRSADAEAASHRAIEVAETLDEGPALAKAYATRAYLRMLNRDYAEAVAWGERAIALAGRLGCDDTLASAYNSVGAALTFVDYARGREAVETGLRIARTLDDGGARAADAYVMLGTAAGEVSEYGDADRFLAEGIGFARAHDLDRLAGYMEAWQALVDVHLGRWDLAGGRANALLTREQAGSTNRLMALVALGRLRTRRGDPGASAVLDEALDLATRSGTLQRIAPVRAARAEAAWLRDDLDEVRREAFPAFALATAKGHPWFTGELGLWLWRAGDIDRAPIACAAPYASQIDGRWAEAATAWRAIGCPYEEARALLDGDAVAQRAALAIFDRLGAVPMAERTRRLMRSAGVASIPRGPREATRANAASLTTREVEVLGLMARGWQNGRIAASLSRSTRTVEHHVTSILLKLDVGSRDRAVDAARARGILSQDG